MGYIIFEELIRRFSEQSNETAGEHFATREVIELTVGLLLGEDGDILTTEVKVIKVWNHVVCCCLSLKKSSNTVIAK
jgi:type I restriction enzyme M protein